MGSVQRALACAWEPVLWFLVGLAGLTAIVALVSPSVFRRLASSSSRWVDSNKVFAVLDKKVDIDSCVLKHTRTFALVVLMAAAYLMYWLTRV